MGSLLHNTKSSGQLSLLGRILKPLLGAALALGASFAFAVGPVQMKIGTVVWIGYGPFYVADALDLYKKYNLKVTLQVFTDPALIPPAVASGALDGAMLTYDQVIGQVATGQMQKVVMPIDYSNGGDAIVADMSIKSVKDFKGKKIGYNPLSPSDFLLSYALKTAGLSEKDITPVSMTPEAVPAAMASGQMPIGVTYEPSLSQILSQGGGKKFKVVFSSKDAAGLIADGLVFDEKVIK
ncbi:MAG: ABC transporter substrate-binding protein, partial [Curvibacter sp.]